ncbi:MULTISPECIES: NUDIX hydrolase [Halomicrobium]|uniref:NUDIX hydrolase n=2 Tax=Halomicrobium mukohataei TaxID=57705 RepID=C7NVX4_HALMD|nr:MULTISPECIES: NUDIX hydrolase [Halomicrobium]ACV48103.1 NUDIX hydrolase [Halomicrobium mukohataei DSM 12286]QCD66532.1 NUDIX domain-containing protein [Halomicrobium mukohataei]QFR21338.1 NUDIX domain-containing protein [Halomicrobium sp. ZPS1]
METTRHFVATVYVVESGAIALHEHDKLEMWLPPGGHIDRDELPHEAALREIHEELGFDVDLLAPEGDLKSETARSIPQPQHFLLEDINVSDEGVGHQHVDFIFYGEAPHRDIQPGPGEQPAEDWEWLTAAELRTRGDLPSDVAEIGQRAIAAVESELNQ